MSLDPTLEAWLERELTANGLAELARQGLAFMERAIRPPHGHPSHAGFSDPLRGLDLSWQYVTAFTLLFEHYGHTCLPLGQSPQQWVQAIGLDPEGLPDTPITRRSLDDVDATVLLSATGPFVVTDDHVSIRRLHELERHLAEDLLQRSANRALTPDPMMLKETIQDLFPDRGEVPHPAMAAVIACTRGLLILSGGPGTGKTTTVARILAAWLRLREACSTSDGRQTPRIGLAAPTGKAAARLTEALEERIAELHDTTARPPAIPTQAITLHRMLHPYRTHGLLPEYRQKTLPYDLLVVDEASMLDISLFNRMVKALPPDATLIVVGDRNQLSSVEAGAVLDDLCAKRTNGASPELSMVLQDLGIPAEASQPPLAPLHDSVVYLEKNWRFGESSGIGRLSHAILASDSSPAAPGPSAILMDPAYPDVSVATEPVDEQWIGALVGHMTSRHRRSVELPPESRLGFWMQECWLTPLRTTRYGTQWLNRTVETAILREGRTRTFGEWYAGRPVIITRNDYRTGLFNGDVGVCVEDPETGEFKVRFDTATGTRSIPTHNVTRCEPAYFLTVHKSQGSEFDRVELILPPEGSPLLSRELLFTAVTRARRQFVLHGDTEEFDNAARTNLTRHTGLRRELISRHAGAGPILPFPADATPSPS